LPDRVDARAMTNATDFLVSLAHLIDREAGRAAGGAAAKPRAAAPERV
jgi:hypothetical protein